jgi:4-alpha-glucanotransferase
VAYTGTHDNDTTRGWYDTLPEAERRNLWNYLQRPPGEAHEAAWELIRLAWSSVAALAVTPFQDLLGLASAARMNVPGRAEGQWRWRCPEDALNAAAWQRLSELTQTTGRLAGTLTEFKARTDVTGETHGRCLQSQFSKPQPTRTTNQETL